MNVVRARTLKCFKVELYPTHVSKRIVWSVVRSTSDEEGAATMAVPLTTCCSCQDTYARLYVSLTCSWAASDMRRPGSARTAVDDAGAAASGAAGASGAVGATGIARTGRCMGVYLRSESVFSCTWVVTDLRTCDTNP